MKDRLRWYLQMKSHLWQTKVCNVRVDTENALSHREDVTLQLAGFHGVNDEAEKIIVYETGGGDIP